MKNFYILFLFTSFCSFAQISQVRDMYTGSSTTQPPVLNSGTPNSLFNSNGTLYFRATDGVTGVEFWKSDGTSAGTTLVRDINTAANANSNPANFFAFNGTTLFTATAGVAVTGTELYKTDGTLSGTVLIKDINTGTASGNPQNFTAINANTMLFSAIGATGNELYKTDGTDAGTVNVLDYAGTGNSVTWIENLNGTAIIGYIANGIGRELYKSDGVTANSGLISELYAGGTNSGVGTDYHKAFGNIFFQGNSGTTGYELWKTDGTATGTVLVKEILAGTVGSAPKRFATLGTNIYFNAAGANGTELWKSDGTAAGTVEVVDINPGTVGSNPDQIASVNGAIYYFASDNGTNFDLYKYDGTTNIKLLDFNALTATVTTNFVLNGSLVYFAADSNADGKRELWQTDGTAVGTVAVASLNASSINATNVNFVTSVGNKLFFSAEFTDGNELFVYIPAPLKNDSFVNKSINIYPNPTTGIINLENNSEFQYNYRLFDVLGKNIDSGTSVNNQINVKAEKGVYFLELTSESGIVTKKIIKK